jgi:WD40 repeat protein
MCSALLSGILLGSVFALTSCSAGSPVPTTTPVLTLLPPSCPVSIPMPESPVLAGTPVPIPQEPITPENAADIVELAIWGKGQVREIAFSPNGQLLVVGTAAGLWVYDADTIEELGFVETDAWVDSLVFAPSSTTLIAKLGATTVSSWNVATGEILDALRLREGSGEHPVFIPEAAFSADGTTLAAMEDEWHIGLWDVRSGQLLRTVEYRPRVDSMALSSDGALLATISSKAVGLTTATLWDVETGDNLWTREGESGARTAAFSPDGTLLALQAIEEGDGGIELRRVRNGRVRRRLDCDYSSALAFSPDGELLASGSGTGTESGGIVQVCEVDSGELVLTLDSHSDEILSLAFSPDGTCLASGSWDGTVRLWDVGTGASSGTLEGFWSRVRGPLISPDGTTVFLSPGFGTDHHPRGQPEREIQLWDVHTGRVARVLRGYITDVNMALSADGATLASSGWDSSGTFVWNVETGRPSQTLRSGGHIALSPDGKKVGVSPREAKWAVVYSVQTGEALYEVYSEFNGMVMSFSPDGAELVSASWTALALWNAETGELVSEQHAGHQLGPPVFSPDGDTVACGGYRAGKDEIWMWNISENTTHTLEIANNGVGSLAFSPDGAILASGTYDSVPYYRNPPGALASTIQLWNVGSGTLLCSLPYTANVGGLSFSRDGRLLVSTSQDGTVRLWGVPPEDK